MQWNSQNMLSVTETLERLIRVIQHQIMSHDTTRTTSQLFFQLKSRHDSAFYCKINMLVFCAQRRSMCFYVRFAYCMCVYIGHTIWNLCMCKLLRSDGCILSFMPHWLCDQTFFFSCKATEMIPVWSRGKMSGEKPSVVWQHTGVWATIRAERHCAPCLQDGTAVRNTE